MFKIQLNFHPRFRKLIHTESELIILTKVVINY